MKGARTANRPATRMEPVISVIKPPLHDQILPLLRSEIIEGKWPPNSRVPEPVLCERFGISRTPLRDALHVLEGEGLVRLPPNRGAIITSPTYEEIRDRFGVLGALEGLAAELAATQATKDELEELKSLHERMMGAAKAERVQAYYRLNDQVHEAVVRASGSAILASIHATQMHHVERARRLTNVAEEFNTVTRTQHGRLVAAILGRKPEEAAATAREHITYVAQRVLARLAGDAVTTETKPAAANAGRKKWS